MGQNFQQDQKTGKSFNKIMRQWYLIYYVSYNTEQICCAYKSKYDNEHKNQVILLMITDGEKWHYLAIKSEPMLHNGKMFNLPLKSLFRLLKGKSPNHKGDFCCLKCFNSCSTENRLK